MKNNKGKNSQESRRAVVKRHTIEKDYPILNITVNQDSETTTYKRYFKSIDDAEKFREKLIELIEGFELYD
ncbi:hypothetical protein [Virgibacillus salexigens]|uniref:hypothetical protein n=1 Tax=Virgibacillus salexigens TaxID=61016 RepID=UPI00190D68FE|nr:hypothetical protein [Virgibacillus salexigens]